jgi:acyl-coenzyme A synthetase/AMP-(fatty) acid ligase
MTHPLVTDCAAIGVYEEEESAWLPTAFVMLTEHKGNDEDIRSEILKIAETELSDEKQLRGGLYIVDEFPRTSTGKIIRRALRQQHKAEKEQ